MSFSLRQKRNLSVSPPGQNELFAEANKLLNSVDPKIKYTQKEALSDAIDSMVSGEAESFRELLNNGKLLNRFKKFRNRKKKLPG